MVIEAPSFDELMWPATQALKAMGGSATNEELLQKIIELGAYPAEVQNLLHTDGRQTRLNYNLGWAKTYLKLGGAVNNSKRGVWSLTQLGESLTEADVAAIPGQVRKKYATGRKSNAALVLDDESDEVDDNWRTKLLAILTSIQPDAFERLSQRLLRETGFVKVQVTGRSGDGGIDGMGVLRLALLSFQVSFQCKRYKGSVGPSAIRDFRGAMVGRSDKGLFITTGTFTADAQREATRDGAPAIDLIDGDLLCTLLKDLKLGVTTEMVEKATVDSEWFKKI
jgi:restriction system protein